MLFANVSAAVSIRLDLLILGVLALLIYPLNVWDLSYAGVPFAGHALRAGFGDGTVFVVLWEFTR